MKKKILILTPVYKRPEIFKLYLEGYERIRDDADLLIIRSPLDPCYDEIMELLMEYKIRSICYSNDNLGRKKNAGVEYALKNLDFDYMMDLGSDNLVNPVYLKYLFPHNDDVWENPIGLIHLYIWDYLEDEFYYIKNYAFGETYGAGRIYPRKILKKNFFVEQNAGIDIGTMNKNKLKPDVFYKGEEPLILDIKTRTNINPMDLILSRNENKAIKIENETWINEIKFTFGL